MPKSSTFGSIELVASPEADRSRGTPDPESPFRILVIGDFSGRSNRGKASGASSPLGLPVRIDRDNFDDVMANLGVSLQLTMGSDDARPIVLEFKNLEDFHPDRIYERTEIFQALRKKRKALNDPTTFADAARSFGNPAAPVRPVVVEDVDAPGADPASLLDRIIAKTSGVPGQPPTSNPEPKGDFDRFLERLIAPYGVAAQDPRQAELVAAVDQATSQLMRDLLHDPVFQACESAWRGLFFLTRRLDTDERLTVSLVDLTKEELANDLASTPNLRTTTIYRSIVEPTLDESGGGQWGVIVGAMTFELVAADLVLLERIAGLAHSAEAPFLAAAGASFVGRDSIAEYPDPDDWRASTELAEHERWTALRQFGEARYLGLALPRFLLRSPYGKNDRPIESFRFEELAEGRHHEDLLWGNPAFALAELLGRAFSHQGWSLQPGIFQEIEGLPLSIDRIEGESQLTPCAEILLSVRAAEILLARGLMPLMSLRGGDTIRLVRFQSIADPPAPLSGRW